LNIFLTPINIVNFQKTLEDQESINNNTTICRIELKLIYTEYYFEVIFDPIEPIGTSIATEKVKLETIFTLDSDLSSIVSVLIYSC
jgi:hypothetical protein